MARGQLKLGPADHGRSLTLDEFDDSEFEGVARYEIIDGSLYCDLPRNEALGRLHWRDFSLVEGDSYKDLERNRQIYRDEPTTI